MSYVPKAHAPARPLEPLHDSASAAPPVAVGQPLAGEEKKRLGQWDVVGNLKLDGESQVGWGISSWMGNLKLDGESVGR